MKFKTPVVANFAGLLVTASTLGGGGPAFGRQAHHGLVADSPATVTAPMTFGGFNPERAARYGYDVRTDEQGWQYAVPSGTPAGSTVGSSLKYNPATGQVMQPLSHGGFVKPMNTVPSNCGTSTLTLYTKTSGYTAYNLNGSAGAALYHTWRISMSARTGNQIVNRDGFPPFPGVSLSWGTNFSYNVHAVIPTTITGVVSTGVVETELGRCYAAGPRDTFRYE
jgi:hypothetical protein